MTAPLVTALLGLLLGVFSVLAVTAVTGYFVAQEFGFLAVDRSLLAARAAEGDLQAASALRITARTSLLLSGAQLGITVTGLLVGYVAEPLVGANLAVLLRGAGVPLTVGLGVGTAVALLFAAGVQMVLGELLPKNLAIARPQAVARRLARSTSAYLTIFGYPIRLLDRAATALLTVLGIRPVHDVDQAATAADLERIVSESRRSGQLAAEVSVLLERALEFPGRTAGHAMVPRPRVVTVRSHQPVREGVALMARGTSCLPVLGPDAEQVVGLLPLRDVLRLADPGRCATPCGELARPAVLVPSSLPLPAVRDRLLAEKAQLACVMDEYGGLAGVITAEDLAEELVGEITDEHDPAGAGSVRALPGGGWLLDGATPLDEAARLLGHPLPDVGAETVAGLVIAELGRLPEVGDAVELKLPATPGSGQPDQLLTARVYLVARRVPVAVRLTLAQVVRS